IGPSEILIANDAPPAAVAPLQKANAVMFTERPAWAFATRTAEAALTKHFGTHSLDGFGFDASGSDAPAVRAAGAVLEYLQETQRTSLAQLERLAHYPAGETLEIGESTRRSLESTRTLREGRRAGTLYAVMDRTVTPMGARLLAEWLESPLTQRAKILTRQAAVAELV